ncbi:MAG: GNAT family N-acetyltransferase [Empedobacter falsenii]
MVLENEFVRLEILNSSHFKYLKEFVKQRDIWTLSTILMETEKDMEDYINVAIQHYHEKDHIPFAVYDKVSEKYVGSTRLYEIKPKNKIAKLGYTWYGKEAQGTRVNKNCKLLLLNYAFEVLNFQRIGFDADTRNKKSIAAMQSIGAEIEGVLRSHTLLPNGYRRDTIVLSILKQDWENELKKQLEHKI